VIADTWLSVGTPVQRALPALLRLGGLVREQIAERIRANRHWLEVRSRRPDLCWELLQAEGGWYSVLRVPRVRSEEEWCHLLIEKDGVLLHPGYFFEFESEAYLVTGLLLPEPRFQEAMSRVLARIEASANVRSARQPDPHSTLPLADPAFPPRPGFPTPAAPAPRESVDLPVHVPSSASARAAGLVDLRTSRAKRLLLCPSIPD
jgi:hypothetical protein